MERTTLPRCRLEVSRLGLGLSRLHYISEIAGSALIGAARDLGITHFDTARLYGDGLSERVLGRALKGDRRQATIATKFGLLPNRWIEQLGRAALPLRAARSVVRRAGFLTQPTRRYTVGTLERSLRNSLDALGTDYIDILFVHDPHMAELASSDDLFARLVSFKKSGAIRAVGITAGGVEADALLARYGGLIDVVQTPEADWPSASIPDITYGVLGADPQLFGTAALSGPAVLAGLRAALVRRPRGCVLVGTTKTANLQSLAQSV